MLTDVPRFILYLSKIGSTGIQESAIGTGDENL